MDTNKAVITVAAIAALLTMQLVALAVGIDGAAFQITTAAIAGLAGFQVGKKLSK